MRHIHLDPLGGLAGDMFLAALIDAAPEHLPGMIEAMRAAGLPPDWRVEAVAHGDGTLTGRRLLIEAPAEGEARPSGTWRAIRERLEGAALPEAVRARAVAIFALVAEAEAAVHGIAVDDVHFHELADWDSVADIVGAAWLIEALQVTSWSSAPLPLGGGRVRTRHGPLPVPAPATARLLEGLAVLDDGIGGERVTPTGAAIARHLAPAAGLPPGPWHVARSGFGFGSKRLEGISNVLRVVLHDSEGAGQGREQVAVIAFEVDDQSPEELALALEALRAAVGVLDVIQLAAYGKKGRLGAQVQVLARPERLDAVIDRCFVETTTIGLRFRIEARAVLAREQTMVEAAAGPVEVKVVQRPGGVRTAKAEAEAVRSDDGDGQAGRARRRRWAEDQALAAERESRDG